MRMEFHGWERQMKVHRHKVRPVIVKGGKYVMQAADDSLTWTSDHLTYGKVEGLALSGAFLVHLRFEEDDLTAWLECYVATHPERAAVLLATMQAKAVVNLAKFAMEARDAAVA